jgi:hypothetical protein
VGPRQNQRRGGASPAPSVEAAAAPAGCAPRASWKVLQRADLAPWRAERRVRMAAGRTAGRRARRRWGWGRWVGRDDRCVRPPGPQKCAGVRGCRAPRAGGRAGPRAARRGRVGVRGVAARGRCAARRRRAVCVAFGTDGRAGAGVGAAARARRAGGAAARGCAGARAHAGTEAAKWAIRNLEVMGAGRGGGQIGQAGGRGPVQAAGPGPAAHSRVGMQGRGGPAAVCRWVIGHEPRSPFARLPAAILRRRWRGGGAPCAVVSRGAAPGGAAPGGAAPASPGRRNWVAG